MAIDQKFELESEGNSSKPKMLIPLLFALLNLGVGAGGVYLVYISTLAWEKPSIREAEARQELEKAEEPIASHPLIYKMDPFVVNLDGKPLKSIRLEVNVELLDEDGFQEVADLGPEARDSIVRLLNGTKFEEIESIQGKLFLKDRILVALNDILTVGVAKDVYFTDFLIQ